MWHFLLQGCDGSHLAEQLLSAFTGQLTDGLCMHQAGDGLGAEVNSA
jgi:hypothetical protein